VKPLIVLIELIEREFNFMKKEIAEHRIQPTKFFFEQFFLDDPEEFLHEWACYTVRLSDFQTDPLR
jgi:hypothetical protein